MTTTYKATRGNRLDQGGVLLIGGGRYGSYNASGAALDDDAARILTGGYDLRQADPEFAARITETVRAVASDGVERTVTVGAPAVAALPLRDAKGLCPRCHTYCSGDCTTR